MLCFLGVVCYSEGMSDWNQTVTTNAMSFTVLCYHMASTDFYGVYRTGRWNVDNVVIVAADVVICLAVYIFNYSYDTQVSPIKHKEVKHINCVKGQIDFKKLQTKRYSFSVNLSWTILMNIHLATYWQYLSCFRLVVSLNSSDVDAIVLFYNPFTVINEHLLRIVTTKPLIVLGRNISRVR